MTERRWGRSSRQESGGRNWSWDQGETLSTDSFPLMCSATFLYTSQVHLPRDATTHIRLDPPMSINNSENVPQTCLQADLMETVPQQSFLFLGMSWFVPSWQTVTSRMAPAFWSGCTHQLEMSSNHCGHLEELMRGDFTDGGELISVRGWSLKWQRPG